MCRDVRNFTTAVFSRGLATFHSISVSFCRHSMPQRPLDLAPLGAWCSIHTVQNSTAQIPCNGRILHHCASTSQVTLTRFSSSSTTQWPCRTAFTSGPSCSDGQDAETIEERDKGIQQEHFLLHSGACNYRQRKQIRLTANHFWRVR